MKGKNPILFCFVVGLMLVSPLEGNAQAEKVNKVLIIGIDGCRSDALQAASTPNMDALWKNGAYSFKAQTDEISSSGPAWTAMLTGVWHQKHNVVNNDYTDPDLEHYPHFFHRVRKEKADLALYSVVNWGPIHKILQEGDATYATSMVNDARVVSKVAGLLKSRAVDAMFVQLDEVDGAGHTHGYGVDHEKYLEAIEKADKQVGKMVSALGKRSQAENENWLIILSTDHGGSDHGHGKNIPEHTTVFYIASGPSAEAGEISGEVGVVDVAVTAMEHLGVAVKTSWNLDGKVAGL